MITIFNKKAVKFMAIGAALIMGLSSCDNWLDVNVDPDSPNSSSAVVENRLPWIQRMYMYDAGIANMRSMCTGGMIYSNSANNTHLGCTWNCQAGTTTSVNQVWFVMSGNNLNDMEKKAAENNSIHYIAAGKVIRAIGFMLQGDMYGEAPMSEAFQGGNATPKHDTGKEIYEQCDALLDEAIDLFSKKQEGGTPLAAGDLWLNGDADKWLKLCYGLKARWALRLSKRADFNADKVIEYANKALASNDDNAIEQCYNVVGDVTDWLYGDPIMTNGNWDYAAYGSNQRYSKFFTDMLTNSRNKGIQDPRADKIIPSCMTNIKVVDGKVASCDWMLSKGVDMYDDADGRLMALGAASLTQCTYVWQADGVDMEYDVSKASADEKTKFIADMQKGHTVTVDGDIVKVHYAQGNLYSNTTNKDWRYAGDTVYVNLRSGSTSTDNADDAMDLFWYFAQNGGSNSAKAQGAVGSTGCYQLRTISDFEIMTYEEICFIKAECYMRKGDAGQAYTWYKNGIQANMDRMQANLHAWEGSYGVKNPAMTSMDDAAISSYMASAALAQSAGELKMQDIMEQKYIALGCSQESWVDVRRFNYSAGNIGSFGVVYPGLHRSVLFTGATKITGSDPSDPTAWPRRWRQPNALELNYNQTQVLATNAHALDENIWCMPVWWDCASDAEYENYLK